MSKVSKRPMSSWLVFPARPSRGQHATQALRQIADAQVLSDTFRRSRPRARGWSKTSRASLPLRSCRIDERLIINILIREFCSHLPVHGAPSTALRPSTARVAAIPAAERRSRLQSKRSRPRSSRALSELSWLMTLLNSRSRLSKCSRGRLLHEIVKDRGGSRGNRNGGYASHDEGTHFLFLLFLTAPAEFKCIGCPTGKRLCSAQARKRLRLEIHKSTSEQADS
jgi:hypothetical protein